MQHFFELGLRPLPHYHFLYYRKKQRHTKIAYFHHHTIFFINGSIQDFIVHWVNDLEAAVNKRAPKVIHGPQGFTYYV